ncbi:MAG: hypothetical protein DRN35_04560 [Thermoplasmata archaeon]|nr:MAG: hypothetical protein DRN28_02000 [Thermoplasmata archaeon]RLF70269.1 MAG: hypothetical protein DRN35_04560 [Thermoplasmata archaeon]
MRGHRLQDTYGASKRGRTLPPYGGGRGGGCCSEICKGRDQGPDGPFLRTDGGGGWDGMRLDKRGYVPYSGPRLSILKRDLTYLFLEVKNMLLKKRSIVVLVFILFLMSFPVITSLTIGEFMFAGMKQEEVNQAILSQYVEFSFVILFLGLLLSAITVAPRISEEVKGGPLPLILSRPITRDEYFLLKFSSSFLYMFTLICVPPLLSVLLFMGSLPPSVHFSALYVLSRVLAIYLIYAFFLTALGLFSSSLMGSPTSASLFTFFLPWITEFIGGILRATLDLPQKYTLISLISGTLLRSSSGFVENLKGSSLTLWHQALALAILLPVLMLFTAYTVVKERQEV